MILHFRMENCLGWMFGEDWWLLGLETDIGVNEVMNVACGTFVITLNKY